MKVANFAASVNKNPHHWRNGFNHVPFHVDVVILEGGLHIRAWLTQQLVDMVECHRTAMDPPRISCNRGKWLQSFQLYLDATSPDAILSSISSSPSPSSKSSFDQAANGDTCPCSSSPVEIFSKLFDVCLKWDSVSKRNCQKRPKKDNLWLQLAGQ